MKRTVRIGSVNIGGDNPIAIQSMTNEKDFAATVRQINELEEFGCEIIRCAIPNLEWAIDGVKYIKQKTNIPLVADIHFDYRLAIEAIKSGVDKIRINPGNIGGVEKLKHIVQYAKEFEIPIRVGANAGSLGKSQIGIAEAVMDYVKMLNALDFDNIVLAAKSSDVLTSVHAYEQLNTLTDYPLHVGITEAGSSVVKSCVGIGSILSRGIGNTIRVSLTDNPVQEVKCAKEILSSLRLRRFGIEFVSCPTCARTHTDLIKLTLEIEKRCANIKKHITVAIMGCEVNGPGEAAHADIGVACSKNFGVIFKKGVIMKKVELDSIVDDLVSYIEQY